MKLPISQDNDSLSNLDAFTNRKTTYSVEELVAQLLGNALDVAAAHTDQRIKACVITVPPFFNQAERRAILSAADLSGLKVGEISGGDCVVCCFRVD